YGFLPLSVGDDAGPRGQLLRRAPTSRRLWAIDRAAQQRRIGRRSREQTTVTNGPGTAQTGSPVTSKELNRSRSDSNMMRISRLARVAPRQWCGPPPPNAT